LITKLLQAAELSIRCKTLMDLLTLGKMVDCLIALYIVAMSC